MGTCASKFTVLKNASTAPPPAVKYEVEAKEVNLLEEVAVVKDDAPAAEDEANRRQSLGHLLQEAIDASRVSKFRWKSFSSMIAVAIILRRARHRKSMNCIRSASELPLSLPQCAGCDCYPFWFCCVFGSVVPTAPAALASWCSSVSVTSQCGTHH